MDKTVSKEVEVTRAGPVMALPPPPTHKLPPLPHPHVLVSDTETSSKFKYMHRKQKRKYTTVHGVTQEARRVLEHMLRRGVSQSDAPPTQSDSSNGPDFPIHRLPYRPYEPNSRHYIKDQQLREKLALLDMSMSEGPDEPDYVYTHEIKDLKRLTLPPKKGDAPISQLPASRPRPITPPVDDVPPAFSTQHSSSSSKSKAVSFESAPPPGCSHGHEDDDDEMSSTSTEDYEYTDPNEFLRRKKKSFFRRATERLMHSFRRRKEHPLDFSGMEDSPRECPSSPAIGLPPGVKKKKSSSRFSSPFKCSKKGAQFSPEWGMSCSMPSRPASLWPGFEDDLHQLVHPSELVSPGDASTHYTDIEQFHQESLRRSKSKSKDGSGGCTGHLSDGGRDRNKIWGNIVRQIKKKGSFKLRRKGVHSSSKGADAISRSTEILSTTLAQEPELVVKAAGPRPIKPGAVFSLQEAMSRRLDQQMGLPNDPSRHTSVLTEGGALVAHKILDEPDYDEIEEVPVFPDGTDGLLPRIPFSQRTPAEKDELYERIADQLAAIADSYNETSIFRKESMSPVPTPAPLEQPSIMESSGSSELEGAAAPKLRAGAAKVTRSESNRSSKSSSEEEKRLSHEPTMTEQALGAMLRNHGDYADTNPVDVTPLVQDLVRTASYSKFQQIVNENIGTEPGWHQIAMVFRLTQTAVQMVGLGTAAALQIKEMTMQYFEDRFAGWIVNQGGWESVVEDTNTEQDSELD